MSRFLVTALTVACSIGILVVFSDAYHLLAPAFQAVWFIWFVFYVLGAMREMSDDSEAT